MKKSPFAAGVLGALTLLLACSTPAQDDRATMTDVFLVLPKSGMTAAFEQALREHIAYRQDAGETRAWETYTVALGDNPSIYQFRSGGMDWADFDAGVAEDGEKGLGSNWAANVDQYVEHLHHYIEVSDFDNSDWPEDLGQKPYYGVTTWSVNGNAEAAADAAREEFSRVAMAGNWSATAGNWMWLSRVGGSSKMMLVTAYDSFANMAPPEESFYEFLASQVGEDQAASLFADFGAGYTSSNYTIWAYRPDLSGAGSGGND